ncbi:MAG: TIM-barrel domain-containing protein [Acidobacteriaceae bacterium]
MKRNVRWFAAPLRHGWRSLFPSLTLAPVMLFSVSSFCQASPAAPCTITQAADGAHITGASGTADVQIMDRNIVRVDLLPHGESSPRTVVLDPSLRPATQGQVTIASDGHSAEISAAEIDAKVTCVPTLSITVNDASGQRLVSQQDALEQAAGQSVTFLHDSAENLYGMRGLALRDNSESLLRNNGATVAAGAQGDGGAPWFFTPRYGVLIDSENGVFDTRDGWIEFSGGSRKDLEYFVVAGPPMESMAGLAELTGRPPLPPKWTLGFLNSQWGSNEGELKQVASTYRAKHIPFDAFILDFDWKAWGEDNYGEWRWNSTSGPGNFEPDKFPDGASGLFAKELLSQGVKLAGILKPRILLYKVGSTTRFHEAAAYANQHHLWYPGEPSTIDYFTHRPARDLDFSNPETRAWYWKHLKPAFDAGMHAWWNDEADVTSVNGRDFYFDDFQFLNMGRMLWDGQRADSHLRVWSINRNYYLGADRYGYAEWSGDIQTGFQSMQHQESRMLATLDLGEPHWSMDTGGFFGRPTDENYARWIEFAAFVPIDRVHGALHQHRQPWLYGPVAEAAATKAIRLRYELLPYIYSSERTALETGIGIVRPLFWMFPDDPAVANDASAWMFGDALLVSPIVTAGETQHSVHLPPGVWYDYFRGTRIAGDRTISVPVDTTTWTDIPLFIRSGSILATQPVQDYVDQKPIAEVTFDIFPGPSPCLFTYYDDDGNTYAYERDAYYRQQIRASEQSQSIRIDLAEPSGSFHPALRTLVLRVHGRVARSVLVDGKALPQAQNGDWTAGNDRFGPVTTIRVSAGRAAEILVQ